MEKLSIRASLSDIRPIIVVK